MHHVTISPLHIYHSDSTSKPMNTPPTPMHPAGDAEVNDLPHEKMEAEDFDLNPDLDDSSDEKPEHQPEDYNPTVDVKIDAWTDPFDVALSSEKTAFSSGNHAEKVSETQQSGFISFMDAQLLQVQRRFIRNQTETTEIYPFRQLVSDVSHLLNVLWFSISPEAPLYGQEEYVIKILGDLEDWIQYYEFPVSDKDFYASLFVFLQSLDTKTSILIEGYQAAGRTQSLNRTQLVRLNPIVSRLRLNIVSKMEPARAQLYRLRSLGDNDADSLLNVLDVEVGRLFEGILERL